MTIHFILFSKKIKSVFVFKLKKEKKEQEKIGFFIYKFNEQIFYFCEVHFSTYFSLVKKNDPIENNGVKINR